MNNTQTHSNSRKKKIFRVVKWSVIVYGAVGFAAYHLQDKFMFHPKAVDASSTYNFATPHHEVNIPVDERTNYHLVQFTTPGIPKGVVLYFHGNMENVEHYASSATNFTNKGYEVWMIDYPGFGKSTGELTEAALYQQSLQVYKMSRSRFQPSEIIIYGRSMGSGVAAQLASIRDCKRLILETPYYSLTSLASRFLWMYPVDQMIRFKLPTNQYLTKVSAPVSIFHGTNDGVIPYRNATRLKEVLKQQDEFITIEGGSHNDLGTFNQMKMKLANILDQSTPISTTSL